MKYAAFIGVLFTGIAMAPLAVAEAPNAYVPRLADVMAATQLRHFKLWFAGKLRNWDLAAYELTQIKASLEDATTLYTGIPTTNMDIVAKPLQSIGDAIEAKNSTMFAKAFGDLTTACNGCHQANGRGFIVVKVPTASPFSNQSFSPDTKP